ncbi:replication protein [Comamonas thiooxydans]|uniref:Replication protein n=1 Tax=Comamonas thiooxydans TaxID=363952 RepID=A0A0E3B618_9BURK|nr:replication protein RepA [Comamonas thiooxydans]KGG81905.1 replication protein [Comamonas thiooxydans]
MLHDKPFNEAEFRAELITRGVDPETAADVAARTAAGRKGSGRTTGHIQTQLALDGSADPRQPKSAPVKRSKPVLPTAIPAKLKTSPPTARELKLIKTGAEIASERPGDDDLGYMHSIICQVGLPRSEVQGTSFERISGGAGLLVEAGKLWDGKQFVQQPIPYGPMPRLILAWMNTYAVRFNTPEIPIGDSASEFLRMLGKQTNGGKRGAFTTFKKQVQALSACRMTLGFNANGMAHTYEGKPIKHFEAWLAATEEQRPLWPGTVTFSEDYYKTLKEHAVPLDLRAFMELKGSALAMDVYAWLAQRLYRVEGKGRTLHWKSLREQFGQEYEGKEPDKNFKKKFLPALRDVLTVYPQARVKQVNGGILVMRSSPPVPPKGA